MIVLGGWGSSQRLKYTLPCFTFHIKSIKLIRYHLPTSVRFNRANCVNEAHFYDVTSCQLCLNEDWNPSLIWLPLAFPQKFSMLHVHCTVAQCALYTVPNEHLDIVTKVDKKRTSLSLSEEQV